MSMLHRRIAFLAVLIVLFSSAFAVSGEPERYPHWRKRCPVCGMFVYKYPEWIAQIHYTDGEIVYFDGLKDMFTYLFDIRKYHPERSREDIEDIWVREYYGLTFIQAEDAIYVIGSDVLGPMGNELVPFAVMADVNEFIKDHGGDNVLSYHEVSKEVLKTLK